jgi:hypothetical protein
MIAATNATNGSTTAMRLTVRSALVMVIGPYDASMPIVGGLGQV